MNYVQQREAVLKQEYQNKINWIRFCNVWETMAKAMDAKRNADYYAGEFNKIRAQYVKRGRKAVAK